MKKLFVALSFVVLAVAASPAALAQCPTAPTRVGFYGNYYWNYTPDPSCFVESGSVSATTMWCLNTPAWETGIGSGYASYVFEAETSLEDWNTGAYVELSDPTNSSSNYIDMWVLVDHNSTYTWYHIFHVDGTGDDVSCGWMGGGFDAVQGDLIEVVFDIGRSSSLATVQVSLPPIINE